MIQTKYGSYDGNSWESLCQLVFKDRYGEQNYQEMPASPGDFGIEGFIHNTGVAIQCYCPEKQYTQKELYEKQRDKITKDLKKLKDYERDIAARIGRKKIKEWIFLTPEIHNNDLYKHAQLKQTEVAGWNLSIIDSDFKVLLKDAEFYASDIHKVQSISGEKIKFLDAVSLLDSKPEEKTIYEDNISRKNEKRCTVNGTLNSEKHRKLNEVTASKWIDGEQLLKDLERTASELYFEIVRVINQYEDELEEISLTWQDAPNKLVSKAKSELADRIKEAIPSLGDSERYKISDHMVSKWIALCPLEID